MSLDADTYWLSTSSSASARLNLQHLWNQLSLGYLVHPDIPVSPHAKIADIATGTGIWPISLSRSLPSTVEIDGFDITDGQYPPKEWLPANVTLGTLNILEPIPEHLVGKYDIVNIRYFALSVKNSEHLGLLKTLTSLLRPGGYLQWVEVNIQQQSVVGARPDTPITATLNFSDTGKRALSTLGVTYNWFDELPTTCKSLGMVGVQQFKPEAIPALRPMSTNLAIGGWEEFSYTVLEKIRTHPILGTGPELRQRIQDVRKELLTGAAIEQLHYVTIAQRPV